MPTTVNEKLNILGYKTVVSKTFDQRNWVEFERQLTPVQHNPDWPHNAYYVICGHPYNSHGNTRIKLNEIAGKDDLSFIFYIDPGEHVEWSCMNAFYKNSFLSVDWFINGQKLLHDTTVYKIQLHNFLGGWIDFKKEIVKVCDIIGHKLHLDELQAIENLYQQWKTTILDYKDIETFKKIIGFN